ncbi:MAG: hypothetical protein GC147_13345 [Porphyrobacter sp.]|nr:hypothetical protein [Porphyrobacter sp.]
MTAVAGLAIGIVGLRLWQSHGKAVAGTTPELDRPVLIGPDTPADGLSVSADRGGESTRLQGVFARLGRPRPAHLLLVAAALVLVAAVAASVRGTAASGPDQSASALPVSSAQQQLDDVDTMIARLASRLEQNPDDGEGYRMLGWSYVMTDRPELAIAPYKRALELVPGNASVHAGYGEALVAVAKNTVTAEAKSSFETALRLDPAEPRARYFLALWDAQNGKEAKALDALVALANSGPADAPWQADVRREIERLSGALGTDVSARLLAATPAGPGGDMPVLDPATIQAAQALPPAQQESMVSGMVDRLAQRLAANPADADGWVRLLRARMVLGQRDQAAADLKAARTGLGADAAALGRINAAARELQVPGA